MTRGREVQVIEGLILEPVVGGLHENLGLISRGSQHALNPEHFVADGVAVAERRQDLVDRNRHDQRPPGPPGRRPRR